MKDYKKLYEDANKRVATRFGSDVARELFQDLYESENEKIRKEIIEFISQYSQGSFNLGIKDITFKKWLAWLEEQGEKLPVGFYYVNSEGKKFYSDTLKYGDVTVHVEKDEQIPANSAKTCKDEQKNADKVEPKREPKKASCNDYKKIIEHYGVRNQLKKLSEEVFELQEAVIEEDLLCGVNGCNNKNITEEIADVFVILRQLAMYFDIDQKDIEDIADYKVKRTLERIKKEVQNENEQ